MKAHIKSLIENMILSKKICFRIGRERFSSHSKLQFGILKIFRIQLAVHKRYSNLF